jgi:DNA-directed RNA polymerase specialized sigma24 family protein
MLWHPEDAEDATQEILVKVLTHLSTFRRESTLRTWVFRISANHLLSVKKSRLEQQQWGFDRLADDLSEGIGEPVPAGVTSADQKAIVEEIKIGCTQAMLLCLDREQRLAYVPGDVFELDGDVAADILDIEPAAYRKRFSGPANRSRPSCAQIVGWWSEPAAVGATGGWASLFGRGASTRSGSSSPAPTFLEACARWRSCTTRRRRCSGSRGSAPCEPSCWIESRQSCTGRASRSCWIDTGAVPGGLARLELVAHPVVGQNSIAAIEPRE